ITSLTLRRADAPSDGAEPKPYAENRVHRHIHGTNCSGLWRTRRHESQPECGLHDEPRRHKKYDTEGDGRNESWFRAEPHDRQIEAGIDDAHRVVEYPADDELAANAGRCADGPMNENAAREPCDP